MRSSLFWVSLGILSVVGCDKPSNDDTTPSGDAQWYLTCGDPVCNGYTGPWDGVPECTDQTLMSACADVDATCDPHNNCNARMICATSDPTQQTGGCPISRLRHKKTVHYLSEAERAQAAATLATTPLASWRYSWEADDARPHLGFIIDDNPASPAVMSDGEHVDLYGYTSLTVAALQAQQAQVQALTAQVQALQAEVQALQAQGGTGLR